jgi:hypothetical protein
MRTVHFDSGDPEVRYDNPNLIWGEPSYLLEPGDPGYVPPISPAVNTTINKRTHKMKKDSAIKRTEGDFSRQLLTFKNNIGGYSTVLGLDAAVVTAQGADALYYKYTLDCADVVQNAAQQYNAWKLLVRAGGALPPTGAPVLPSLPTSVTPVAPGVEGRFRKLVQDIKAKPEYNDAMGAALGIEGAVLSPPDLASIQPKFEVEITGGQVFIDWSWQNYADWLDAIELQVDRGEGKGFVMLAQDTTPGYTDTAPFPTAATKWTYRAIFVVNDSRVGQWSNTVTVLVG